LDASRTPCSADPTLWFALDQQAVTEAKTLCLGCPERPACLRGAVERAEPWGVWGGELFHRGVIVHRLPRQPSALRLAQLASAVDAASRALR
jgi:WhiB family transcriptional regulator, redox-sensing transcriptional regulator